MSSLSKVVMKKEAPAVETPVEAEALAAEAPIEANESVVESSEAQTGEAA
ncbi:hypothetical protein KW785_01345 [Candidatus Parcubacteria bacterium]|nr:hypothetical protein [Candidatus Parcubacteria bacterium]